MSLFTSWKPSCLKRTFPKRRPLSGLSPMNLCNLGQKDIKDNLENYVQSFSRDAREIFGHFNFSEFVGQLDNANQRRRQSQPRCCATRIT